jgi:hypothetical protein
MAPLRSAMQYMLDNDAGLEGRFNIGTTPSVLALLD